jgi:hypothetical protein
MNREQNSSNATRFVTRQVTDKPLAQDQQRLASIKHRNGGSELFDIERVGTYDYVRRTRRDIVPSPQLVEKAELGCNDLRPPLSRQTSVIHKSYGYLELPLFNRS